MVQFNEKQHKKMYDADVSASLISKVTNAVICRDYKEVASNLKRVYPSATEDEALRELDDLYEKWAQKYPQLSRSWRQNWDNLNTFFSYPHEIRKAI